MKSASALAFACYAFCPISLPRGPQRGCGLATRPTTTSTPTPTLLLRDGARGGWMMTAVEEEEAWGKKAGKLADGCRHVFLDVGSNIGVHARMLLEPHLYPVANRTRSSRRRRRGADEDEYCVFGFEPNPAHASRHREMEGAYSAVGWRYHFVHAGVGDVDGNLTFYHVGRGDRTLERGFTTNIGKCKPRRTDGGATRRVTCTKEVVRVVRLSSWIDREVHGRYIPEEEEEEEEDTTEVVRTATSKTTTTSPLPPRVVMKMDIEFSELLVLPDLLTSGVLCRDVDAVIGEFHTAAHSGDYPISFPDRGSGEKKGREEGTWTLNTYEEAERLRDDIIGMVHRNPNCKTQIVIGDDETYARDGMPWPVAS
ncbi:hypothetical protein ACHAXA_011050 [Cyclostephanos tholiformis]|uniref:Methyltransferase FkbM domain-containing protein n=1 Tax=Cyclostephanos tholiformis TaxID=382380 RepID=A0ABD3RZ19_9STRA